MARLIVTSPEGRQTERELKGTVVIGRAKDCDLPMPGDAKASRNHCRIEQRDREFALSDLGSANGTRVNGEKIGQHVVVLKDGDVIVVGGSKIEFVETVEAPASGSGAGGGLLDKVKGAIGKAFSKGGGGGGKESAGGVVFGNKTITCSCGAVISTATKSPGQKVGCPRCKKIYAVPGK